MISRHGEMQGIACAQAERRLIGKTCCRLELSFGDREENKRLGRKPREGAQRRSAMLWAELLSSYLDRERSRELGHDPRADDQFPSSLSPKPILHPAGLCLVGECTNQNRSVEIRACRKRDRVAVYPTLTMRPAWRLPFLEAAHDPVFYRRQAQAARQG